MSLRNVNCIENSHQIEANNCLHKTKEVYSRYPYAEPGRCDTHLNKLDASSLANCVLESPASTEMSKSLLLRTRVANSS